MDDTPWAESFLVMREVGFGGIVVLLRFFFGIEVIQIAVELVEPVNGWQELIEVAKVVLAELARGVALLLEEGGDRYRLVLEAHLRAWNTHLGHAGAVHTLPSDERGAACGAGLLAVGVGEEHPLIGNAVDVG